MDITIRKFVGYREEILSEGGREADEAPLIRAVSAAVISNPSPGVFQEDVSENIPASVTVGEELTKRAFAFLGDAPVESYGKGAIVGADGVRSRPCPFLAPLLGILCATRSRAASGSLRSPSAVDWEPLSTYRSPTKTCCRRDLTMMRSL